MRLIIKAHKYIKRWRGPSGKYHYQYAREKGAWKSTANKGAFNIMDTPEQSVYISVDDKKMLVPKEQILATFEKFGATWFVVPWFDHVHQKINPNKLQVMELHSGLRIKTFDTGDVQEAIELAVIDLDKHGYAQVSRTVNKAKAAVDLPDNSKVIQAYGEKPSNLDTKDMEALAKQVNEKLDEMFDDESMIVDWLADTYSDSELPIIWEEELEKCDDGILEMAIKENVGLPEASNLMAGTGAILLIANQHSLGMNLDDIEDWISNVGLKDDLMQDGDAYLGRYGHYDDVLGEVSYGEVIARALQQGVHPQEIESQLESEAGEIRAEHEEEQAVADYGEVTYDLNYDPTKAVYYDLPPEKAEKALRSGSASGGKMLGGGCNGSFRVQVSNGDSVEVVYKPYKGERHDLRDAVPDNFYVREAAAYELDKMLGVGLVPPTIIMDIDGDVGSAQYFVQAKAAALTSWRGEVPIDQVTKATLLDYLMFNLDRHDNNFMIDAKGNLILIDNGLAFPRYEAGAGYRTPFKNVISAEHEIVPPEIYQKMENLILKGGVEQRFLSMGLDQRSVDGLMVRWNKVLESGKVEGDR